MGILDKFRDNRTCNLCHKKLGSDFFEIDKSTFHVKCYSEFYKEVDGGKIPKNLPESVKNFAKIKFNLENDLEALIEIDFVIPTKAKIRLFFGKEGSETIYSRDYLESSKNNFIHMKIKPSHKQYSTQWNKDGTQNVGDNFEAGYTMEIFLRDADSELRKYLIDILRSREFGCLPTARTIYAHLDDAKPNEDKAKEILKDILDEISSKSKNS